MKSWLEKSAIEMYSAHNEGESVATERFIRTLKNKIYKHMTSISKNVYIDKLDDIVNKYNNIYHGTIKLKPVDVKVSIDIDFNKEYNKENPKFEVGDVRMSKYKNIFVKVFVPSWSKEVLVIKKVKTLCRGHMLLVILQAKKLLERFTKTNGKKQNKNNLGQNK